MPIDSSIYLQQQAPDILGNVERGMRLSDMARQRKKAQQEEDFNETLKGSYTPDASGKLQFNEKRLSDLAKVNPQRAYELQKGLETDRLALQKQQAEEKSRLLGLTGQLLGGVSDQASYDRALVSATKMGIPGVEQMPRQYDPGLVKQVYVQSLKAKEQADFLLSSREADRKDRESVLGKKKTEAEIRKLNAETGKLSRQGGSGAGGVDMERFVPGVGTALTKGDAKELKNASVMKQKLDSQVQEMIDLRSKYGAEFANRAAVARGQQLSKDILLTYKNLQKLGVLSQADEAIINAIIPSDPLQTTLSSVTGIGEDPILSNLQKFKADNQRDYEANLAARLQPGKAPSGGETKVWQGVTYKKVGNQWVPQDG